jgi:cell fate regulator YaaT (PSP1 superfamily)
VQINTKNEQTGEVIINSMDGSQVSNTARMKAENGRVLRVANNSEIDQLHHRIADLERVALHACRQRCAQLELAIEVIDCEYQFDLKKVSFFFNSDHSVDFRDLVRELYREFGARIWMENINPNVKNVMPEPLRSNGKRAD